MDEVHHLAFVNGTEFFYSQPDLVLDVGVRGMVNVIDACRKHGIGTWYSHRAPRSIRRRPRCRPTRPRRSPIPDPLNPRYSYGGGKLISELMAINFGRKYFNHVLIFRPHNVYGPDMGWEHVVPQLALRLNARQKTAFRNDSASKSRAPGKRRAASASSMTLSPASWSCARKASTSASIMSAPWKKSTIADLAHRIAGAYGREIELWSRENPRQAAPRAAVPIFRNWQSSAISRACR